ncbi:HEPN domain-containing protein [Bacillus tropicus]|uniref:HEPN domain-containing protein n=1 Tax=Bacillus tropicus TaxID=2026188 RepID=UPI0011A4C868|nr:HEPN domain-containing protein [Bacillus tropicus]
MRFCSNNVLDRITLNNVFQFWYGKFHTDRIKEGNYFLISDPPENGSELFKDEEEYKKFMDDKNDWIHFYYGSSQIFSLCLWLIKDNSVNVRFGVYHNNQLGGFPITKNVMVSNSKGRYETKTFQKEDFETATKWFETLSEYYFVATNETEERDYDDYNNLNSDIDHNTNSFKRALTYLEQSRSTSFLPAKIASYISILETLFVVTDSNTYKTPERTSVFLEGTKEERSINFKIVKDSYDVRSSFVHGSDIYKKHNKRLDAISSDLDNVVRKVLIKFFTDFKHLNYSGDDYKRVNQYFVDLVLGGI